MAALQCTTAEGPTDNDLTSMLDADQQIYYGPQTDVIPSSTVPQLLYEFNMSNYHTPSGIKLDATIPPHQQYPRTPYNGASMHLSPFSPLQQQVVEMGSQFQDVASSQMVDDITAEVQTPINAEPQILYSYHPHYQQVQNNCLICSSGIFPENAVQTKSYRCFNCIFAHTECKGTPGLPCQRCIKQVDRIPVEDQPLSLNQMIFFDMKSTHDLLVCLRDETERLANLEQGSSLESLFNGSILCRMDYSSIPREYSNSSVPVVIKHLATTRTAAHIASCYSDTVIPHPALDSAQMDSFIDIGNRMRNLEGLSTVEQGFIITALRCTDYLGILFNWNSNLICYEKGYRRVSVPQAKNLVLETMYSFTHRIQDLMMRFFYEVNKSLIEPNNHYHDPATISCALWILYSSLNSFKHCKWEAKSLVNLKKFLNGLQLRSAAFLTALQRYRHIAARKRCGELSSNLKAFKCLIEKQKRPKPLVSFMYESCFQSGLTACHSAYSKLQSYTDVLESSIHDDVDCLSKLWDHSENQNPHAEFLETSHEDPAGDIDAIQTIFMDSVLGEPASLNPQNLLGNCDLMPPLTIGKTISNETNPASEDTAIRIPEAPLQFLKQQTAHAGLGKVLTTLGSEPPLGHGIFNGQLSPTTEAVARVGSPGFLSEMAAMIEDDPFATGLDDHEFSWDDYINPDWEL